MVIRLDSPWTFEGIPLRIYSYIAQYQIHNATARYSDASSLFL